MTAFGLGPGVIVDPQRCVVYFMNPHHGIDAVEARSGTLVWSTTQAARPLSLVDKRLIAQAEPKGEGATLKLVVLDVERAGAPLLQAELALPDGVRASIDENLGNSFTVDTRMREGRLFILWRFSHRQVSGLATQHVPENGSEFKGAVLVDLKTGRAKAVKRYGAEEGSGTLPPNVRHVLESGALAAPLRRVGNTLIAIQRTGEGPTTGIIARRWNSETGQELPEARVQGEPNVAISADGHFLLSSKPGGADARGLLTYTWTIYSLDTGERVAEMRGPISVPLFFVCRHRVLVYESPPAQKRVNGNWIEEPLELWAVNMNSHSQIWSRALRDTAFRGTSPPTPG